MIKLELYDTVELLETLVEGEDFISFSKQNIEKGSKGHVLELNGDFALVEFSYDEYADPVVSVKMSNLTSVQQEFSLLYRW